MKEEVRDWLRLLQIAPAGEKVGSLHQNASYDNKGRAKQAGSLRPKCAIRWEDNVAWKKREGAMKDQSHFLRDMEKQEQDCKETLSRSCLFSHCRRDYANESFKYISLVIKISALFN